MPNKCLLNVEYRITMDLRIDSDIDIVIFFKKVGNEGHFKSTTQVQKPEKEIEKETQGVSQQNSFASANFFYAFKSSDEGFQNSDLLKTLHKPLTVKRQAQ